MAMVFIGPTFTSRDVTDLLPKLGKRLISFTKINNFLVGGVGGSLEGHHLQHKELQGD